MFTKLLYLMLVSFHYKSLIIVNDIEIFVCIDDIPLLKVTFLYVSKYTDESIPLLCMSSVHKYCCFAGDLGRKFQGTKVPAFIVHTAHCRPISLLFLI